MDEQEGGFGAKTIPHELKAKHGAVVVKPGSQLGSQIKDCIGLTQCHRAYLFSCRHAAVLSNAKPSGRC